MFNNIIYCEYDSRTELLKTRKGTIIDPPSDAKEHINIEDNVENMYFVKYTDNDTIKMFLKDNINKVFVESNWTFIDTTTMRFYGYFQSEREFIVSVLKECSHIKDNLDREITLTQSKLGTINATSEILKKHLNENYPVLYYFEAKGNKYRSEMCINPPITSDDSSILKYDIDQTVFEKPDGTLYMYLSENNSDWFKSKIKQYNANKICDLKEQIRKIEIINEQLS